MVMIPGLLLGDTVTIEPYAGVGLTGPAFGAGVTTRAHVQTTAELAASNKGGLVGASQAAEATDEHHIWIRWTSSLPDIPAGSRVTCRGKTLTTVQVHVYRQQATAQHVELHCQATGFLPDTLIAIFRGAPVEDSFGDLVDSDTPVTADQPAAIVEQHQTSSEPADQRGGVVETYSIRMRSTVDVREGDRIHDQRTDQVYVVLDVTYSHTSSGPQLGTDDVMATCRRVTATSTPPT